MSARLFIVLTGLLIITSTTLYAQENVYTEAPMLTERVNGGELPPVAERLPETPRVIETFGSIGKYGGTLRFPYIGTEIFFSDLGFIAGWEYPYTWTPDGISVVPNVFESVDINEDATEFIIHMRKGMRWSDGAPFTADDIMFALDDIFKVPGLIVTPPTLIAGGRPVTGEKIDDWTVKLTFAASYGLLPENLAQWQFYSMIYYPKHWMSQFHNKYNPDGIDALIDAHRSQGISTWQALFNFYAGGMSNLYQHWERPTLNPWIMAEPLAADGTLTLVRNPNFWQVDEAGNQLPYIDRIVASTVPDLNTMVLRAVEGDFDIMTTTDIEDLPVFRNNAESSGLAIHFGESDSGNTATIHFNLTSKDTVKNALFNDINFRIGMSHAINRQEVIDLVFYGVGTPRQFAPMESSPLYNEQMATQYTEYNLDLANQYLDQAGLQARDAEGYRLYPDGNRVTLELFYSDLIYAVGWPQIISLLERYWEAVGIDIVVTEVSAEEHTARRDSNNFDITIFTADGGTGITAILDARNYVPNGYYSWFGMGWSHWLTNRGASTAVNPPNHIRLLFDNYTKVIAAPDPVERLDLMRDLIQTVADDFYVLGISSPPPMYSLLNHNIKNFPETWIVGFPTGKISITQPEQWYFDQ